MNIPDCNDEDDDQLVVHYNCHNRHSSNNNSH